MHLWSLHFAGLKYISRCSKLSNLKLGICLNITDEGLIHIGKGCSKLLELDLYRSAGITGLTAIAVRCKELTKLDIKCHNIDDDGMLPSHFLKTLDKLTCPIAQLQTYDCYLLPASAAYRT
ncbi:hypothetical protein CRYUN_Cryun05aG0276700 [Craigia yunnanensis]